MSEILKGISQTSSPYYSEGQEGSLGINSRGHALVSMGLPERVDLVRLGNSWGAAIPTGSAFTYVNAWPTTRAEIILYNGESGNNAKSYLIDRVWMANITSIAGAQPITILGQMAPSTLSVAAPTDNTAIIKHNLLGSKGSYTGNARLALANTAFALTNQWFALASVDLSPTTNLGGAVVAECYGRYVITPGATFCLAGLSGTAAGTAILGVEWHEALLSLG